MEKKTPFGDWEKVNDVPLLGESAVVPDLVEGEEYQFRVAAVTDAGVGDYSNVTMPTKAAVMPAFWKRFATKRKPTTAMSGYLSTPE